ncbi:phosphate ABC transporter, permease protein PstA, partial [Candidatus Woesearchaeota archaeon]|nr:phosphate ABC transporter, permease protein PstA [Candidatus Woesearchaeota archaeon]
MVNEHVRQNIYFISFRIATFLSVVFLLFILLYTLKEGIGVIDIKFLTSMWFHRNITRGGIFPAIIGTIFLAIGVSIISIPIGICTAIYLNEYAKENLLTRTIKLAIRNLAGVPSIVYGIFGLSFFVLFL